MTFTLRLADITNSIHKNLILIILKKIFKMDSQTSGSLSRNGTAQTSTKSSYIDGADDEDEFLEEEEEEEEITPAELILKLQQVDF
jgi:hypothetical protein